MKSIKVYLQSIFILMCFPGLVFAASSDFTIRTQIVNDLAPPTTPNILTVIPIAPTQIDISWSASTDDVLVAGYRVFRDAVQVATTTLLSYSDAGLLASTTYSYTVDAFDAFDNYSSTSLPVATTTLANPPVATTSTSTTPGSSGTRTALSLSSIQVDVTQNSAQFTWETNNPSQYTLVWGRTTSYELGSVSGSIFSILHTTNLTNLEPGTRYFYELRATNVRGVTSVMSRDSFVTKSSLLSNQLPNVRSFTATARGTNVSLSWINVFENINQYVRVVRSHLSYPDTIQSGAVVYEGRSQSFIDSEALLNRSPQYYTIFVLDRNGNVSSGAVARVFTVGSQSAPIVTTTTTNEGPLVPIAPPDMGSDSILQASNITLVQSERTYWFEEDITLSAHQPYLISIPYGAVAKNLKSIIVTVQNPSNQLETSAYLLKLNQTGDAYTAFIPSPEIVGNAALTIEVFDYEQATVRRISTTITFVQTELPIPFFPDRLLWYGLLGLLLIVGVFLLWWLLLLLLKRKKRDA